MTVSAPNTSSLRVRVINSDSGLSKDLLVEARTGWTLFDAIYNTDTVKKANVRKWNSTVTQNVKSGSHEIKLSVFLIKDETGDATNGENDTPAASLHNYSVTDLKQTSTKQLYTLVGGPELGDAIVGMRLQCVEKKKTKAFDHSQLLNHPPIPTGEDGGGGKILRCPFSGIAFDESALKDFIKDQNESSA